MARNKESNFKKGAEASKKTEFAKSKRLVHVSEFAMTKGLSNMQLAGFKAYITGKAYKSLEDWETTWESYQNRTLK